MQKYFLHAQFPFCMLFAAACLYADLIGIMSDVLIYTGVLVNSHIFFFIRGKYFISFIPIQLCQR